MTDQEHTILLNVSGFSAGFLNSGTISPAVNNISFGLEKGKVLGIVGESGSGKSVTSLALMGLLPGPPVCRVDGRADFILKNGEKINLFALPEKERRKIRGGEIAMIFQEPMTSLNPVYRCGPQVTEAIQLHHRMRGSEAREKALDWFSEVRLPHPEKIFNAYPHELSGGQKQRVMIAMAMACGPTLLIADEPTTALDVTVQKNILELMKRLQEKYNMGMIFISHDLGVVSSVADRVMVMYRGDKVEEAAASSLFSNPAHPYTRGLLASRPPLDSRPLTLLTVEDFLSGAAVNIPMACESSKSRQERHQKLYAAAPLFRSEKISVRFPLSRSITGKVKKWFYAVRSADITVYPGETLGLVGESGCGKTTFGRTLIRLTDASTGKIICQGKDITKIKGHRLKKFRKEVQIVFQDPYSSLNPRMSAGEALMEPMKVHGLVKGRTARRKKAIELLEKVGLGEAWFDRYPHEFSGGQRQRVCIARALALEPKFIVCDESVSALDVSVQAQVLNLLNDLKKEFGLTFIFISHDLSVVRYMSDRIVVMKEGRVVEYEEADKIFTQPGNEYTASLIASLPSI